MTASEEDNWTSLARKINVVAILLIILGDSRTPMNREKKTSLQNWWNYIRFISVGEDLVIQRRLAAANDHWKRGKRGNTLQIRKVGRILRKGERREGGKQKKGQQSEEKRMEESYYKITASIR